MHYKDGSPAAEGDAVLMKRYSGKIVAGTLHSTNPGTTTCNGTVAFPVPGGVVQECNTIGDLYPADKAFAAMELQQGGAEAVAGRMYDAYCVAVGGKAFNGDPLPIWTEFRADESKRKQSDAWVAAARVVVVE